MLIALLSLALVACDSPSTDNPPAGEKEKQIRSDGETVTIFGSDTSTNFDIVYPSDDLAIAGDAAGDIYMTVTNAGISAPILFADKDKSESKVELLVGETSRPLSSEAKALLADKISAEPDAKHWIWLYKNGQLAFWANSKEAYDAGLSYLTEKYFKDGEFKMSLETNDVGYVAAPIPPHDAYMEYEVFDNFYDGYEDPFGIEKGDYKEMIVTRADESKISIDYHVDGKTYYRVNFVQKRWGMWMLGAITYVDNGVSHAICPGSTDYEFVFRCANEGSITFRSGNHADYTMGDAWDANDTSKSNDRLLDMTLYDAKSGDKIDIDKVGSSVKVDGLRIILHHNIYEQEYAQENVLMNVEKSYLFNGFDVLFDAKLYMTQNVKFDSSYSCMFPITKSYGNCMMLYNMDGTTTYAKTSPVALGGREYDLTDWNHKTTKVELWGENNPEYHMTVEIMNPDDQFSYATNKSSYLGIRDMLGGSQNKLYFTFGTGNPTLKHGEELHFVNKWSFSYHEGFENLDREPDVVVIRQLQ